MSVHVVPLRISSALLGEMHYCRVLHRPNQSNDVFDDVVATSQVLFRVAMTYLLTRRIRGNSEVLDVAPGRAHDEHPRGGEYLLRLIPVRDFRLVWSAGVISQLGDWSARLALALLVLDRSGNAVTVGIVGVLFIVPWLGIGQALTAWSTKFTKKVVLIACDSFRGVAFVLIGFVDLPTPILLATVFLAALADPAFEATKSAFITELVPKDDYPSAIQMVHVANQASSLMGYAIGGVLVALVGPASTLVLNGVSFLLSSLLIVFLSVVGVQERTGKAAASFAAGRDYLRTDAVSAVAFAATVLAVATAMSVESQVAVYGTVVAGFGEQTIGLLSAMTPAATLGWVAMMKTSGRDSRLVYRGLLTASLAAAGGSILFFFGVGGVLAFVGFALVGIMFSFVPMTNVVVGRRLPDENRVSIFSILQSGVFLGLSVGALLGGILSDAVSPESAAGGALAVGALGLFLAIPLLTTRL